jgi:hypothetical protein
VPTALKVEMVTKVLLEVAVMFPAVVAVEAVVAVDAFPVRLPVTFPVTFPDKAAVMVPAEKFPLASLFTIVLAVFVFVAAFTLVFKEVILDVLEVILFDTVVILESKLAIVEELTPPTVFTVGELAVPPKSPVNCTIPFDDVDASEGAETVVQVKVPLPVVLNNWPLFPCIFG